MKVSSRDLGTMDYKDCWDLQQSLFDALIAAGVMRLLFSSDALRVCDTLLPWIAAVVLCALFFPLHSTLRFRRGCQD